MRIYGNQHAKLEVDYIQDYGKLEDRLNFVRPDQFKDSASIAAWKDGLHKDAPPVFEPLGKYFASRARWQKAGMAATLIPIGAAALSALQTGLTSGNLMLGVAGLALNIACQVKLAHTQHDLAALMATEARFHRDADRTAAYLEEALRRQAQQPAPPAAPAQPAAAAGAAPAAA